MKEVAATVSSLRENIDFEKKKREESTVALTEEIESELNKFNEVLLIEKKVREET